MLDKILGSILETALTNNGNSQLGNIASRVLQQLLRSQGGVEGIFAKLQQEGLGGVLDSWIGTGKNQPITRDEVSQTFGGDAIQNIAQKAGISTNQTEDIISQVLPHLIDMLTPNGRKGGVSLEQLTRSVQTQHSSNQDLLGSVLGNIFGQVSSQGGENSSVGELFNQILNTPTQTSQTQEESSDNDLAKDINAILNNFFK